MPTKKDLLNYLTHVKAYLGLMRSVSHEPTFEEMRELKSVDPLLEATDDLIHSLEEEDLPWQDSTT